MALKVELVSVVACCILFLSFILFDSFLFVHVLIIFLFFEFLNIKFCFRFVAYELAKAANQELQMVKKDLSNMSTACMHDACVCVRTWTCLVM
jgi:hypothetical protein